MPISRRLKVFLIVLVSVIGALIASFAIIVILAYTFAKSDPCESHVTYPGRTRLSAENGFFYSCDGKVYVADGDQDYFPLAGSDPASIRALPGIFAKDKDRVYYMASVGYDMGGGAEVKVLEGADPKTFKVVGSYKGEDARFRYNVNAYGDVEVIPVRKSKRR